ncbi:hypothetical protein QR77_21145 [Streptomyces sp. 150FB]|nr:hypothetical protein QR77_21145 [Streptomyces sp. 150FB]
MENTADPHNGPQREPSRRRLFALAGGAALTVLGAAGCAPDGGDGPHGQASVNVSDSHSVSPSSAFSASPSPSASTPVSPVKAPPATAELAANVNENLDQINFEQLKAVSATWIRGFYPMENADQGGVATQPGPAKLLTAATHGYGTVLNLKFQYGGVPIPVPGTPAMRTALTRLDKVLAATMNRVDIVAIGNEPFLEARAADSRSSRINDFYEALAQHAAQYRQSHFGSNSRTKIYMGALTHLDDPASQTAQTRRWMAFTAKTQSIAGVDIHPHVGAPSGVQKYLDYVLPSLRADQRFLATEFSLVQLWKAHLSDPVDPHFAAAHGIKAGTPIWQVVKNTSAKPFTEKVWNAFLLSNSWYADNRTFLTEQMERFRSTGKLAVAGYGITQNKSVVRNLGPQSHPWMFNSLFCPFTCEPEAGGLPAENTTWCPEFRADQHR